MYALEAGVEAADVGEEDLGVAFEINRAEEVEDAEIEEEEDAGVEKIIETIFSALLTRLL